MRKIDGMRLYDDKKTAESLAFYEILCTFAGKPQSGLKFEFIYSKRTMNMQRVLLNKRLLAFITGCLFALLPVPAQTYVIEKLKPSSERHYSTYSSKKEEDMVVGGYHYSNGFIMRSGRAGLVASNQPGFIVFDLPQGYEKMSFVLGPLGDSYQHSDENNAIVTVKADGKKILDKVIHVYDAPQEVVLNIKGVQQLRFDHRGGEQAVAFAVAKLWKPTEKFIPMRTTLDKIPTTDRVQLVGQLYPYFTKWMHAITKRPDVPEHQRSNDISINRVTYKTGIQFSANEAFMGHNESFAYFWLQKKYDKLSFIVGPRDNQASGATGWMTVKADGKIIYEKRMKQDDLAERVVLDVKGVNQLAFYSIDEHSRLNGGITFGIVNIFAYPTGYDMAKVPKPGLVNGSKKRLSALPDMCPLIQNIKPFSVQGVAGYEKSLFDGSSDYITFSMGGEKFSEGFILTPGKTLLDEKVSAYWSYDLANEFDYLSFTVGALTKRRTQSDDRIIIKCDDRVVLDTMIHVTWPNQRFIVPLNKCRLLTFAKPGTYQQRDSYFGIGDITLYRGEVKDNSELFSHPIPECPDSIDLIDLCKQPYYHYVGRFLSTLTNFDFNDCFQNGGSMRRYFQMKDGTKIYKGVMLETNIPFALENITPLNAAFMFLTGAGGAMSGGSDFGAYSGTTAGDGGVAGMIGAAQEAEKGNKEAIDKLHKNGLNFGVFSLFSAGGHQSSACAFNPYGEYDELTFTVACKSPYVDPMRQVFEGLSDPTKLITDPEGKTITAPPVKLCVFADQVMVGEYWVYNEMKPTTVTVPINKCHQLMFWLECGEERSGQYVLYDMTVRKKK